MFKLFSVLAVAGLASAQTFMVNTPSNVVECEPTLITWTGGVAPYILSIQDGNNPNGASLVNLGTQTGTQFTWNTSLTPQSISLAVRDSTGVTAQSAPFPINSGSSSCITASSSSSSTGASTSSSGSSTSSSGASSTSSTSSSASTPGSTTSSVSSPSTGSTASKTSSTSKETSTSPTGSATTSGATTSTTSGATQVKVASFGIGALIAAGVLAVMA